MYAEPDSVDTDDVVGNLLIQRPGEASVAILVYYLVYVLGG